MRGESSSSKYGVSSQAHRVRLLEWTQGDLRLRTGNVSSSSVFILVILGASFTSISQATGKLAPPLIDSTSSILVPRASSFWLRRQLWQLLWDLEWNEPARNRSQPNLLCFPAFAKLLHNSCKLLHYAVFLCACLGGKNYGSIWNKDQRLRRMDLWA